MNYMTLYEKSPIWLQNVACNIEGLRISRTRFGRLFWKFLDEYEYRNNWSYDQKCEYRDHRLRIMVKHCYDTVPYYRDLFKREGINPDSICRLDDLKKIPILTKEIVNKQPDIFISNIVPRKSMIKAHTSGTTGAGFKFNTTQQAICEQWAVWWRYRRSLGIEFGHKCGNFGTRHVVPVKQSHPPYWRYNYPGHQVYFSAFHESKENVAYYLDEIKKRKIDWLHGYPSLLVELANVAIEANDTEIRDLIKYITIGAENLLEYQAVQLERAFGVHVFQHYGLSEGVANFSESANQEIYVDEDFAAVEFIKENGYSKIVGTTLTNFAMPLLRWDTKDTAEAIENRNGRLVKSIDGRIEDYITLKNGVKIGKLDHVFKDAIHLKEVQIVQKKDYSVTVYYVPYDDDYMDDMANIRHEFDKTVGNQVDIEYQITDKIDKSKSGKLRFIKSEV